MASSSFDLATFVTSRLGSINSGSISQVGEKAILMKFDLVQEVCGPEKSTLGDLINHNVLLARSVYQVKFSLRHHDDDGD